MNFRESTPEDIKFVADRSISRSIAKHQPEQIDYCYTLEHEGVVLGVGGFRLINLTTAWCWTDWTYLTGEHITTCYRVVKEWIDVFVEEHKLKRLQCYVETDFEEGIRMVTHLGFKKEFEKPMKNFVGDKDAFLFIRII